MLTWLTVITSLIVMNMPESGLEDKVLQSTRPLFTFGVIADVQYCNCEPAGTRYYSLSTGRLREAVGSFRADSVNFVINLGDLIDRDYESFGPVLSILDSSDLRVFHVTGNHDYSVENRLRKKIPVPMPSQEGYYSFSFRNYRFIALNGNEISTYASANRGIIKKAEKYLGEIKESGSINAFDWNGGLSERQLEWLKDQLDISKDAGEKVFILCHFPVFPENVHNLLNYEEVNSLLMNYDNIIAWFSGHNHAGNYGNFNMIHFVTFRGMVETAERNSFAVVEVYPNKIWIKGSGREKSQILAY